MLGKPLGINPFPRAFANASADAAPSPGEAFDAIYRSNGWNSDESLSGPGSEVERASAYRSALLQCLKSLDARSLFDAPCGDLNWIRPATSTIDYIGGDIAPSLIGDLKVRYPELDLRVFDICQDRFPDVDIWHCRDCLFHLPLAYVQRALQNFAVSSIPYALLTTHRSRIMHRNLDIPVGGWRYLDLEMPPISLPPPVRYLRDYRLGRDFPRFVGLWKREQIAAAVA